MKKLLTTALLCGALLLTGCADRGATVTENSVTLEQAGITLNFPDDWSIISAEEVYQSMYADYYRDEFDSVEAMIEVLENGGMKCYPQASSPNTVSICNITSQDMTPAENEEPIPLNEYARTVHDSAIFEYLASGFKTGDNSSFSQETYGGRTGYLSHFELYIDGEEIPVLGFSEFMFQMDMQLYSIQICYFSPDEKDEALGIFDSITEA